MHTKDWRRAGDSVVRRYVSVSLQPNLRLFPLVTYVASLKDLYLSTKQNYSSFKILTDMY